MALDAEIKEQLGQYLQLLESEIVLQAQLKDDANSQKVKEFLQNRCNVSYDFFRRKGTSANT